MAHAGGSFAISQEGPVGQAACAQPQGESPAFS